MTQLNNEQNIVLGNFLTLNAAVWSGIGDTLDSKLAKGFISSKGAALGFAVGAIKDGNITKSTIITARIGSARLTVSSKVDEITVRKVDVEL